MKALGHPASFPAGVSLALIIPAMSSLTSLMLEKGIGLVAGGSFLRAVLYAVDIHLPYFPFIIAVLTVSVAKVARVIRCKRNFR